ncbi:MAG: SPOR domain-containing protein, partial [Pseudomonadota bacterium]|nr:SPOR domain-containing protein [Pseudomonadota bacterium]
MRAFLILLLIANMGYFAWREGWFAPAPAQVAEIQQLQFRQAEQALTLLSELSDERRELMSTLAEARAARTQAVEQLQQVQQQAEAVTNELEDNAAELAEDQVRSAEVQQDLLETLDAAVTDDAAVAGNGEGAARATTPWCANTSIFADPATAAAFAQGAAGLGAEVSTELREQPVSSTWWVYLAAFSSEADARAMLSELQGKGIDSYFMRTGEMAGGISLGVYSREESARIAQRQLVDQGYMPDIREVFRMEERPFVRVLL